MTTTTPIYAGLPALLFVFLSVRVIGMRRATRIGPGDGGNAQLLRRQRAQGNFAEYAQLALWLRHPVVGRTLVARTGNEFASARPAGPSGRRPSTPPGNWAIPATP
ncbi:MAG: MAPEG family protein [Dongiaceae bacterium]